MGTAARVLLDAHRPAPLLHWAEQAVAGLEQRWSRFLPASDLQRVNEAKGRAVPVAPGTAALVALAVRAWQVTDGWFDPTVLAAVRAAGYDRPAADGHGPVHLAGARVPGCGAVVVDEAAGTVASPVALDLGGIGKGRAADLVVHALVARGARGVLVDLGGDVRVAGEPPDAQGWCVGVEDPFLHGSGREVARLALADGAVATSGRLRRSWPGGHHLIDPSTGRPSRSPWAQVTVVASTCVWAEVFAKAVLLAGPEAGTELLDRHRLAAVAVDQDGTVTEVGCAAFVSPHEGAA